ncbi:MAG: HAMP domain-containing histidine kinase [Pseudomonadota bacterium]|nr:HAMP domain-containing histidine kinase [Pseudomonadota bacterium]
MTQNRWMACAVHDESKFGLKAGSELDVDATLGREVRQSRIPVVIERASAASAFSPHPSPSLHIESYVSVPIVMPDGRYFGNLCAIDRQPASALEPRILSMFMEFAELIALELDHEQRREQERKALIDERAAAELREQFIAVLGHDLRNPLHAVSASGELLVRKLTDPALLEVARRIKTNSRRMSRLIDDVLDLARGRLGGGIGVQLHEVENIEQGLSAVIQELQDAHPQCQITSAISVRRAVRCDLGRLQQVASNLLANALTHGSPTLPVQFTVKEDREDWVLEVWNAGEPIPADCIDKIFEPFWRYGPSGSSNGLGLGLYISSQIVKAHKGTLTVSSTVECGTRFTARFPSLVPTLPLLRAATMRDSPHPRLNGHSAA